MVLTQAARSRAASNASSHDDVNKPTPPAAAARFPVFQLFVLAICRLSEPVALTSVLPIAFPMVRRFDIFAEKDVPFYAGILVSAFALAEALTGCFWGTLSDRIGRKPVLLLGLTGTMLSIVLFGLAQNFWLALAARTVGGLLNGNVGVIQTMVGELVTQPEHEPRAYAVMPFVWSVGTILGPAVSALAADSALFPDRPYLLPNLISAGLLLFSILVGFFLLEETRQVTWDEQAQAERPETRAMLAVGGTSSDPGADLRSESYGTFTSVAVREEPTTWKVKSNGASRPASVRSFTTGAFTWKVVVLLVCQGLYCYHSMAFNHLFAIFAQEARRPSGAAGASVLHVAGGLGLTTQAVGVILSVNGIITLLIQGVVFPLLAARLGVWRLFRLCVLGFPAVYFAMPYLAVLPAGAPLFAGIYAAMTVWDFFNIILYPLILILIKEASNPKRLGTINGMAASVGAVARCLAPPIAGCFYSVGYDVEFAGVPWWLTGMVAVLGAVQLATIKRDDSPTATATTTAILMPFEDDPSEKSDIVHIIVEEV